MAPQKDECPFWPQHQGLVLDSHPFAPHPFLPPALRAAGSVSGLAVLDNLPGVARSAPLLPVPVVVPAQVDRDEEQLRFICIMRAHWAILEVLMQHLQQLLEVSIHGSSNAGV